MSDNVSQTNGMQDGGSPGCPGNPSEESALLTRFAAPSGVDLVAALQVELTERWRRGERCLVDSYLLHPLVVGDDESILDLIFHEFLVRSLHGESPRIEEYVERFPSYGDRLRRLLSLERALFPPPTECGQHASRGGEPPPGTRAVAAA